jgi:ABC-type branched-subunit amino acid transport system ATPase component/ABC-type branched-subunit amino acid transport system permease subunit
MLAFEFYVPSAVLGLIVGTTYGLLAIGLVLVYRSSRVINFAQGAVGAFTAVLLGVLVQKTGMPYYLAFVLMIALGATLGVLIDVAVMRRLKLSPQIVKVVATVGVAAFLAAFSGAVSGANVLSGREAFPVPPWVPSFEIGSLYVGPAYTAMLIFGPVAVGGLAYFVQSTRYGRAIRGSAANPDAARLSGASSSRMSALAWALAGGLSAFTAMLLYPTIQRSGVGVGPSAPFGSNILLLALAAAVIGRMTNLPLAFVGGLIVGVVQQLVLYNSSTSGPADLAIFALIMATLLLQPRPKTSREQDAGDWVVVEPWPPLPTSLRRVPAVRRLGWITAASAALITLVVGALVNNASAVILSAVLAFATIGLGLSIISGLAGQLSLGQFALAGVGALVAYEFMSHNGSFLIALLVGALASAGASVLLGIPALRLRHLMFAVATLAFAETAPWLFQQDWAFGNGVQPGKVSFLGITIETSRQYYYFAFFVAAIAYLIAHNVWHGEIGRSFRAVRDNEDNARAFGVRATSNKLAAFAVGGFLTGIGGVLYVYSLSSVSGASFPVEISLTMVAIVAIGGIGSIAGSMIGALYLIALPRFLPLDNAGVAATQLAWLLLVLQYPGGVVQAFAPVRARLLDKLARRHAAAHGGDGVAPETSTEPLFKQRVLDDGIITASSSSQRDTVGADVGEPILVVHSVSKAFSGVRAVSDVSFEVVAQETLGLIGPNGAGKTTLFEMLGGFTRVDSGRVDFDGKDITNSSPEKRARSGLIRSFQDARLFPTLTVLETVELALGRTMPVRFAPALLGLTARSRPKQRRAEELLDLMGLASYANNRIAELSTGTRRITELACALALEPRILLLDEPTSGIAQRETEALGGLLRQVKQVLGTTMVIIEHDIPLIMGISDRIIAMAAGEVIAIGTPGEIKSDSRVIESYLGSSLVAMQRSGEAHGNPTEQESVAQG